MSKAEGERARLNYFNYFTEIEEAFVRRRGRHLLLSPNDWVLMESWKQMGIPLHVVLRGIETAFDSYEKRPRKRSVKSLYYCQEEVEAQFAEWVESQTGAAAPAEAAAELAAASPSVPAPGLPFPREVITAHLAAAREALERGAGRGGEGLLSEATGRAAARLAELERDFARAARPDAAQLEDALTDLEALLDRALRAATPPDLLAEARARAAEQLRPYRERMERATYEQTLDNLLAKLLREARGIPRLSLFYL